MRLLCFCNTTVIDFSPHRHTAATCALPWGNVNRVIITSSTECRHYCCMKRTKSSNHPVLEHNNCPLEPIDITVSRQNCFLFTYPHMDVYNTKMLLSCFKKVQSDLRICSSIFNNTCSTPLFICNLKEVFSESTYCMPNETFDSSLSILLNCFHGIIEWDLTDLYCWNAIFIYC